jgi:uncharacterized protein (TIGR02391 family)
MLGEHYTGSTLTRLFGQAHVDDVLGEGNTKWRRIDAALAARQRRDGHAGGVAAFLHASLTPKRFSGQRETYDSLRADVNEMLALEGLVLRDDGRLQRVPRARTLSEAEERADRLRARLRSRGVHPDVLRFCRAELVHRNYFHAVLEASKSVSAKIRDRTGLISDGTTLANEAFSLAENMPPLAFNAVRTPSERSAHSGYANFVRGVVGAFRNPTAHEPKVEFPISEEDALDMLATISMVHRRLGQAVTTPAAPAYATARLAEPGSTA